MSTTPAISALEQNKHLLVRWFEEVWNQNRREVIQELLAPDCVIHDGDRKIEGPAQFEKFHDALRSEFADFRITPGLILAEGDLVSMRWTSTARHRGTGAESAISGISIVRVRDGKFVEGWQNWDAVSLISQVPGLDLQKFL